MRLAADCDAASPATVVFIKVNCCSLSCEKMPYLGLLVLCQFIVLICHSDALESGFEIRDIHSG